MKRTIEQLTKEKEKVYFVCHTRSVACKFLKEAQREGFTFGDIDFEDWLSARIYAVTEKNISHVSGATIQFFDSGLIKYDRIDYLKYICEEKDYYYHKNENNDIVLIGPSEDVIFEYVDENNQPIIGDYLKVSGYIVGILFLLSLSEIIKSANVKFVNYSFIILSYASMCTYLFHRHILKLFCLIINQEYHHVYSYWWAVMLIVTILISYYIQLIYDKYVMKKINIKIDNHEKK